jgi:hypothetical protein
LHGVALDLQAGLLGDEDILAGVALLEHFQRLRQNVQTISWHPVMPIFISPTFSPALTLARMSCNEANIATCESICSGA